MSTGGKFTENRPGFYPPQLPPNSPVLSFGIALLFSNTERLPAGVSYTAVCYDSVLVLGFMEKDNKKKKPEDWQNGADSLDSHGRQQSAPNEKGPAER